MVWSVKGDDDKAQYTSTLAAAFFSTLLGQ